MGTKKVHFWQTTPSVSQDDSNTGSVRTALWARRPIHLERLLRVVLRLMSCKSVGVSWSQLGSIFHLPWDNSGHQFHKHLGDIQIWKFVDRSLWVKCSPLEEEVHQILETPRIQYLSHLIFLECTAFNRSIRFQDKKTIYLVCNSRRLKWGGKSAGNCHP